MAGFKVITEVNRLSAGQRNESALSLNRKAAPRNGIDL
jgi:hypothetical protein